MIDYAPLLQPDKDIAIRIADFGDGFDDSCAMSPRACLSRPMLIPDGVLKLWLAAWYGRVAKFAPLPAKDPGMLVNLPFLRVLLAVCENWELCFAIDKENEIEVCGSLEIGTTVIVDGLYRLLAVLRLLASWMNQEFRGWVEGVND
ncbi:hypothetical protein LRP88_02260 [Fusarium phalaenopsidis]